VSTIAVEAGDEEFFRAARDVVGTLLLTSCVRAPPRPPPTATPRFEGDVHFGERGDQSLDGPSLDGRHANARR
jgi:hypothetical protein